MAPTVAEDVDLAKLSRWGIGGYAWAVIEPANLAEVAAVRAIMARRTEPLIVVGDTSNVLFDSRGFPGVILRIGRRLSGVAVHDARVIAGAGTLVPELAWRLGCAGLRGIEHTVGIPGTLGGLIIMNGGSQRRGIGAHVSSVQCIDAAGRVVELNHDECQFGYRSSIFQRLDMTVVEATLQLEQGDATESIQQMEDIRRSREQRFPSDLPNCGSTFLSDPAMYDTIGPPGKAIEAAGLKGLRKGDAQISPKHANFFVNNGNASSDDMLWLIALARNTVRRATGFSMDCEVRFVNSEGEIHPAHEAAIERWGSELSLESIA